jgi:hypothetical protein
LGNLINGTGNIAIGASAGSTFGGSESNNIYLNNVGVTAESNTIRIGTTQTKNFQSGISGVTITGTPVFVSSAGQLGIAASSRRFKENILPISAATVDAFMKLNPVSFTYKTDPDHATQYGFIAEEVEPLLPELVIYDEEGNVLTIASHLMYALLYSQIKKDHDLIHELRTRIENLEQAQGAAA